MKLKVVIVDLEIPPRVKKWGLRLGIPLGVLLGGGAVAWAAGLVTWTTGQTLTATDLNANFSYLQGEITTANYGTRTPSAFHATLTSAGTTAAGSQTIPSGTNTTIYFDSVDYDLDGEYTAATGLFTVKQKGIYMIHCGVSYSSAATADWYAQLYKNGQIWTASSWALTTVGTGDAAPAVDGMFALAAGDVLKCSTFQSSGSALPLLIGNNNQRCSFSAARIY